ncbi:MAG: hypothetical protein EBV06_08185 [Planctomycetia bacterium]|nr:hypothetical protein [Planctomycetia bacterium]
MSQEPSQSSGAGWVLFAWVVVPVVLLGAVVVATLWQTPRSTPKTNPFAKSGETNDLSLVRTMLAKPNDLPGCKTVVARLNAHLRASPQHQPPEMPTAERDRIKSDLGLTDDEVAEVASPTFTPLDANHLETCFLLRDAALSLETTVAQDRNTTIRLSPLERAEAGFAWVCRQIRLQKLDLEPPPVAFGLRRGWGTPTDRAITYLALIEQFGLDEEDTAGLQGCLLYVPGKNGPRLWACGVAVGAKPDSLYLFDPRMGLPIPGPDGKGIATLAQTQADAKILRQLDAGMAKYDVTTDDAKAAQVRLVCPLSSAAPRMLLMQNVLLRERSWQDKPLPAAVRVRLAETPRVARATIQAAAKGQPVTFAPGLSSLLRRSLPKEEGGTDNGVRVDLAGLPGFTVPRGGLVATMPRQQLLQLSAVPWTYFPERFRNVDEFGLNAGIGRDLRQMFQAPFLKAINDSSSPREAILRGRIAQSTTEDLVREREMWQQARQRSIADQQLREGVEKWISEVNRVYAAALRGGPSQAEAKEALSRLFRWKPGEPMDILMTSAIGTPRAMELTYQLGLVMQERGERASARLALAARAGQSLPDEKQRADAAYQAAEGWWRELIEQFPSGTTLPAALRLRGEALWALGRKDEARLMWKDIPPVLDDVEKVAGPWLGR